MSLDAPIDGDVLLEVPAAETDAIRAEKPLYNVMGVA